MRRWQFLKRVLIPSFIPLALVAVGQSLSLSTSFNLILIALLIAASGLYLKRLNDYWGYSGEMAREVRRFGLLIWLILLVFPIGFGFLYSLAVVSVRAMLLWIYLIVGGSSLFILLTLLLQIVRFSPGVSLKSFRLIAGLVIAAAVIFTGWSAGLQFLIFFLLAVWIFGFEAADQATARQKAALALICIVALILLAIVGGRDGGASLGGSRFVFGDVAIGSRLIGSVRILEGHLLPYLPTLVSGLKRIVLALLIVLPGKLLFRPLADWLKFSLRIRTKLLLSYFFSSVIPGILLLLLLLLAMFFTLGGYWQLFVTRLIESRAETMQVLWESSDARVESERLSDQFEAIGVSAVIFEIQPDSQISRERYVGRSLPADFGADSLIFQLAEDGFGGLAWLGDSLYLTRWMATDGDIVALFKPFTLSDLSKMKGQCGNDLVVYPAASAEMSAEGVNVQVGQGRIEAVLTTQESPQAGIFNRPFITIPVLSPGLVWHPAEGLRRAHSFLTVKASLSSLFGTLLSTEQVLNRIYLGIFIVLAAFFGAILILVALVGFGVAGGITRSIRQIRQGTQQLRQGDLSANIQVKSKDELGELAESFNLMVSDLNRMLDEVKEKERLEAELEAARAIQLRLLPERIPQLPGFEIAAESLPAKQVGGDYYDFFFLPSNQLGLAVGDVSGKGMPAALLMANLQASLHALVQADLPPETLVERLNAVLHRNTAPQMFATFFFGSLDAESGRLNYVNAGHNYPILCGNGRLERLTEGGLLLGVSAEGRYRAGQATLERGELVALYSDGITEATDGQGQEFGEQRLIRLLEDHCWAKADEILRVVIREVEEFCGTPQDDVTLMVIKRI